MSERALSPKGVLRREPSSDSSSSSLIVCSSSSRRMLFWRLSGMGASGFSGKLSSMSNTS